MTNIDWFKFEKKDLDFPIYKKNPYVPKWGWVVLFISLILCGIFSGATSIGPSIISCIIPIATVLYFLKWDYHAIFQKPSLKEVGLAVALFAGYIIYAAVMSSVLGFVGITSSGTVSESSVSVMMIISSIFSLMGEEFLKFIPFIFFMRIVYKYSDNRKLSVIMSMLLVMLFFAALHAYDFKMLIFAIFIQGFGSIFEFYGYIKTKNILISYITHLCTDVFIFSMVLLGM